MSSSSSTGPVTQGGGRLIVEEPAPGVVRLTISNPDKRGALDRAILDAFASTVPELEAHCLIITGQGTMFSAGYDLGEVTENTPPEEAERLIAHPFTEAIDALQAYEYPTLAALNGHAIGGGLELALACDLRIATTPIVIGMPPAKLGLVYSHTGIRKFIDAIGAPRTRELFLGGRRIDAATALGWGLVSLLAEPDQVQAEALAWAVEIAGSAPLSTRGNKRMIRAVLDAQAEMSLETEHELLELRRACFSTEDLREGVRAFHEKRAPRWRGR